MNIVTTERNMRQLPMFAATFEGFEALLTILNGILDFLSNLFGFLDQVNGTKL